MHTLAHSPLATKKRSHEKEDLLQVLLEGHESIRSFTALSVQLGHAQDASPVELSSIASRVIRYFTLDLPRHIEDEDYALVPRMFTMPLSQQMIQLLWEMVRQHEEIEQLVEQLVPTWAAVRDTPERYPELSEPLASGGRRLLMLMEEHLALEERILFPFVRARFSHAMLVELATELIERRARKI